MHSDLVVTKASVLLLTTGLVIFVRGRGFSFALYASAVVLFWDNC